MITRWHQRLASDAAEARLLSFTGNGPEGMRSPEEGAEGRAEQGNEVNPDRPTEDAEAKVQEKVDTAVKVQGVHQQQEATYAKSMQALEKQVAAEYPELAARVDATRAQVQPVVEQPAVPPEQDGGHQQAA